MFIKQENLETLVKAECAGYLTKEEVREALLVSLELKANPFDEERYYELRERVEALETKKAKK